MQFERFDIVVVGAGHAGAEAASAAARLGCKVLLITQQLDAICQMSCNPAMGGVAKGQIVREIDALGGRSGIVTDRSSIQFRMLNRSKGPAMWSPRAQCDKILFSLNWRKELESTPNLFLWQDEVVSLEENAGVLSAVGTRMGHVIPCRAAIITSGTFLNGKIFIGEDSWYGGRVGEASSIGLSNQLKEIGFEVKRMKTGTPVRIDGRTIDFSRLSVQLGDEKPGTFSFSGTKPIQKQLPCYLVNTNNRTHEILRTGFSRSPMFTGRIQGMGPRYCPSIEDKIERFSDKDHHQLFVEPEGWHTQSYYLNGFSSSLPLEVQLDALHSIEGMENARIFKPGYAIEYDYFPPTQLKPTLETRAINNLFFAGQINGTTGYEEAACQGLMAGINAALKLQEKSPFVLSRSQAYIGVLIDDLVTKGVDEPYRMFTSRAEYRILLRQDNADQRLTPLGFELGLIGDERMRRLEDKQYQILKLTDKLRTTYVIPSGANDWLLTRASAPLSQKTTLEMLLLRPELTLQDISQLDTSLMQLLSTLSEEVAQEVEVSVKYKRYIEKEQEVANRILRFDNIKLPAEYDYFRLTSLSYESREKLNKYKPTTLGHASRISGISPADISVLLLTFTR